MEKITAPNGTIWRLKRVKIEGRPVTGNYAWSASTGGAGHSHQWKFGPTRKAVIARINAE